jgi:hypothetical protein
MFDATFNGTVVRSSATPFVEAARVLLAEGVPPATPLVMRHAGENYDALRSTVGVAAKLTVKDATNGRPAFRSHRPWDGRLAVPVPPRIRENEAAAITLPDG